MNKGYLANRWYLKNNTKIIIWGSFVILIHTSMQKQLALTNPIDANN